MRAVDTVLVVGGGIGGLVAARAMALRGIHVDLIEKQKEWTVYGVGIIQPNNFLRALEAVGLAEACLQAGGAFDGWQIRDTAGNILMDAPGACEAAPHLPANNGITRPKLHKILIGGAKDAGVDIRLGTTVEQMADDGEGVDVTFSDGSERRYDLVVGYDGAFSQVREYLFGEIEPEFTGQGAWRYNLPRPEGVNGRLYYGSETKVGLVPLSDSLMYIFLLTEEPDKGWFEGEGIAEEMRSRMHEYSGLIGELREQITNPEGVVYRPMLNGMVEGPWHKGRIMIAGDAAHSTTPHLAQGAAMAVEDAVVLAEILDSELELQAALTQFRTRRDSRVRTVVDASMQIGNWELEQWRGVENPDADVGGLLYRSTAALMEPV